MSLGLDFPNLPYIIDGDFKLTESIAIAKYIAKRSGKTELLGKITKDQGKVDALISIIMEVHISVIIDICFNKDY